MHDDADLADLPEAVPLCRVAPFWRLLAVLAGIAMVGLLFVTIVFGIALLQMGNSAVAVMPPAPPPVMFAAPAIATAVGDEDESDSANLPYPLRADLANSDLTEPENENPAAPGEVRLSPRQRFLSKSVDLWTHRGSSIDAVAISPDGKNMAYVADENLMAGVIGNPQKVQANEPGPAFVPQPGVPFRRDRRKQPIYSGMPGGPPMPADNEEIRFAGVPSWSGDSQSVDCADVGGRVHRFNIQALINFGDTNQVGPSGGENTPVRGAWPVSSPTDPSKLVCVWSRPRAKVEVPGSPAKADPMEVVLIDLTTQTSRVLVPSSSASWQHLSVSPDGKRLALVSERGLEGKQAGKVRLFVLDLDGGEPRPLTPPASKIGRVCWTPDSQALVYSRTQEPFPSDVWEADYPGSYEAIDLFQWDFTTGRETPLSRGGGFLSPSVSAEGTLFFLASTMGSNEPKLVLRRTSLQAARDFAAGEPKFIQRDASAWTALFDRVLKECQVSPPVDGANLTPEILAKLADTFRRVYRDRFHVEPPSTFKGFLRQRRELQSLALSPELQPAIALVLGAVGGEHLVRRYGARWFLSKGPLSDTAQTGPDQEDENPFGYVVNPFEEVGWWDEPTSLSAAGDPGERGSAMPHGAEGRPLVLANNRAAGQAAVVRLADPDLEKGNALLKQDKGREADLVLLGMMKRHEPNYHLALIVGKLLYEHKRTAALRQLMEWQCELSPADARKFNLLGLAYLETEPRKAVDAFKKALRCDLHFGAAYLNLAQAYQKIEDREGARRCLLRYLKLLPGRSLAADARRRFRELDDPPGN